MCAGRSVLTFVTFFVSLLMLGNPLMADSLYEVFVPEGAEGKQLPCRLLKPAGYEIDGKERYPLVLFLHGAGERGDDNEAQLLHCTSRFLEDDLRQGHPCFVLAPQCPEGQKWVDVRWSASSHRMPAMPSLPLQLALEALGSVEQRFRIDADRIYLIGLSMGGYGTWDLIGRFPDRFAAAVPICGGGDEAAASRMAEVPIWAFHGECDRVVSPERSRNMVAALREAGGQPQYTEYHLIGHNSWDSAMVEPGLFEWLFAQRRSAR
jgi:predicted peptidase